MMKEYSSNTVNFFGFTSIWNPFRLNSIAFMPNLNDVIPIPIGIKIDVSNNKLSFRNVRDKMKIVYDIYMINKEMFFFLFH